MNSYTQLVFLSDIEIMVRHSKLVSQIVLIRHVCPRMALNFSENQTCVLSVIRLKLASYLYEKRNFYKGFGFLFWPFADGDMEEETEEEAKWKQRRLELEKQKKEKWSDDQVDGRKQKIAEAANTVKEIRLDEDANISRVLRDANKSLRVAQPKKSLDAPAKRPVSGGFLNMKGSVLERIADKVKG